MMRFIRFLLKLIIFRFAQSALQFNIHHTDFVDDNGASSGLQHDCLRVPVSITETSLTREVISYCLSTKPSTFRTELNTNQQFTFEELSEQNITSEQLYHWSAPIDLIERYQSYLNQPAASQEISPDQQVFYNCTFPKFGLFCQYEIDDYVEDYSSLTEVINAYYHKYEYNPTSLTCYTHLQCNRGPAPACLDWTEICDGQMDCLDGGLDERDCWQLEFNECEQDEYRCFNGQCIPKSFFRDDSTTPDCFDGSDEKELVISAYFTCKSRIPSFECEDIACSGSFVTGSCVMQRQDLLVEAMYSVNDHSVSTECWTAFKCMIKVPVFNYTFCSEICEWDACADLILKECPDMFYIPIVPMMFGEIYFAHKNTDALHLAFDRLRPPFLCYNDSRYNDYFIRETKHLFNNSTCVYVEDVGYPYISMVTWELNYLHILSEIYWGLRTYQLLTNYDPVICNKSNIYQCQHSAKCILLSNINNNRSDCPHGEDEFMPANLFEKLTADYTAYFKCEMANKYIHKSLFNDGICHCEVKQYKFCEDEFPDIIYTRKNVSFQTTCDNFIELIPITIDGKAYTDESECKQWECANIYTRCDGIWNCPDGQDEIGCGTFPIINCSLDHHPCVSPETNQLMCLPVTKAGDGQVDCLGGTDEPKLCHKEYNTQTPYNFYCRNTTYQPCRSVEVLCNRREDCIFADDEQFCQKNRTNSRSVCDPRKPTHQSAIEKFLCKATEPREKPMIKYFFVSGMEKVTNNSSKVSSNSKVIKSPKRSINLKSERHCHRGIDLRVRSHEEKNSTTTACLCPPSFYGDRCQFQNQRVSLTLQFRALSDSWSTVFAIIIALIDDSDERTVHSYEQLTYLSAKDCKLKFNIYLLYSERPKNSTKAYAIHVDIYEKVSLKYRASLLYQILFPFLPVYRHASIIDIPRSHENLQTCSNLQCFHGKCIRYANGLNGQSFCQCNRGWHGRLCDISHSSKCSSDSVFLGIIHNNRSICVCRSDIFGPRCLLTNSICQPNNGSQCLNGGQCVLTDEYKIENRTFRCICPNGYSGDRCEIFDNKISLIFSKDVLTSQSIFIHFIRIMVTSRPLRMTTLRAISPTKDSIDLYWPQPFHLVFVEFHVKRYYLAILQTAYKPSAAIVKQINPTDRCQNISELFNASILQMHIVRRIKYYHLPCQTHPSNLTCFHDEIHICLCYKFERKRLANCFEFDHNMPSDCLGQSACENGGQCFQDTPDCPQRSTCVCPQCFYGTRCQFSTSAFGLSLDGILGYHILPQTGFTRQSTIVKVSFMITVVFMIAGYTNGFLAIITFKNKVLRNVGCGWYLLGSSITTLLCTTIFALKFWILLLTQMSLVSNRLFLHMQCLSLDFILRVCLSMDQWLNACVALERAMTVIKGAQFQPVKSKRIAKIVIVILVIIVTGSLAHEPFYRRLVDEENEDEKRIWCIVSYSSGVKNWNSVINIFHFIATFVINLVSATIIIVKKSRQQQYIQTHRTYDEILKEQIQQNKRLFVAPVVLVILALPRLIISFISKCMKSTNEAWLFLVGYFISFVPSMLTFIIFVLPSTFYKEQCRKTLLRYRTQIERRLHFLS